MTVAASPTSARPARRSLPQTFEALSAAGKLGLVAFVPAGYPNLETTAAMLPAIERAGASVIEIGVPFSDPVADGPIIQEAFSHALTAKVKMADVFAMVRSVRASVSLPLVAMLSYSIVFRYGVDRFVADAKAAGFDGLIIPDLPPPEAQKVCGTIHAGGLDTILLVAPTTTPARRAEIARLSTGFVYYLSVSGITGERASLPTDLVESVTGLKKLTDRPVCVGFGISKPQHLDMLRGVADGAIVGTGLVRQVKERLGASTDEIVAGVEAYVRHLLSGQSAE